MQCVSSLSRLAWLALRKGHRHRDACSGVGLWSGPSYLKPVRYLSINLANPLQPIVDDLHGLSGLQGCLRGEGGSVSKQASCFCRVPPASTRRASRRIGTGWRVGLPALLGIRIVGGRPWSDLEDSLGANTVRSRWERGGESSGSNWSLGSGLRALSFGRQVGSRRD